jgi:signal transduction histidine kinase
MQAEQAAVLQERERLARDLHDSVTQSLYSLTLLAEAGRRLAEAGDLDQVQTAITRLGEIGQQALKEMRLLVYELRPSVLRREGLVRALRHRLETVERRAGVEVQLLAQDYETQPASLEAQLYHVIQEALNNVLKHAAATEVTVSLARIKDRLRITVHDNGRGFDLAALAEGGGIGLASMQERIENLGGHLEIISQPGCGTKVLIELMLSV